MNKRLYKLILTDKQVPSSSSPQWSVARVWGWSQIREWTPRPRPRGCGCRPEMRAGRWLAGRGQSAALHRAPPEAASWLAVAAWLRSISASSWWLRITSTQDPGYPDLSDTEPRLASPGLHQPPAPLSRGHRYTCHMNERPMTACILVKYCQFVSSKWMELKNSFICNTMNEHESVVRQKSNNVHTENLWIFRCPLSSPQPRSPSVRALSSELWAGGGRTVVSHTPG